MASAVKILTVLAFFLISITTAVSANITGVSVQSHYKYPPSFFASVFSTLGFQDLSTAAAEAHLSAVTPITIFAPTYSSHLTCPSCSLPLLLQEHSVPGLYTFRFLRTLAFGTKIETLVPNRCLTITSTPVTAATAISTKKVFVNGAEITKHDLFNNGLVVIHGVQGFMSHLSPISCKIESMTSLSFQPQQPPPSTASSFLMRFMLKDAVRRLRVNGYSVSALVMQTKYAVLSDLKSLTVFAIDDESIFAEEKGHEYVSDFMFHIVPNKFLTGSDLLNLPQETALPTMERRKKLVVTTAGGGGPLAPMRINYEKIRNFDIVSNKKIVVHGLSIPFRHVYHPTVKGSWLQDVEPRSTYEENSGLLETAAPEAGMEFYG